MLYEKIADFWKMIQILQIFSRNNTVFIQIFGKNGDTGYIELFAKGIVLEPLQTKPYVYPATFLQHFS